ncbi:Nucleolin 1 [Cardamine amara subsp. amara]|uniref:Nucleolin 1 n=1 Tax=Cardamine amara subsp. amara TaxID=228776 RepID=A0ABD0ZYA1_CARAN
MDVSVEKGLELLSLNGSDASILESREIGRIIVEGYDTRLSPGVVESALRKFYSSCGEITDVYVRRDGRNENTLWHSTFVYFVGEGAVDKALQLNGNDVGGWEASAKAFPFQPRPYDFVIVRVEGFDTSLSETDIKSMLRELFLPYGKVKLIVVAEGSAVVSLFGDKAALKAPQLTGKVMGGRKIVVTRLTELGKSTLHRRPSHCCVYGGDTSSYKAKTTA